MSGGCITALAFVAFAYGAGRQLGLDIARWAAKRRAAAWRGIGQPHREPEL